MCLGVCLCLWIKSSIRWIENVHLVPVASRQHCKSSPWQTVHEAQTVPPRERMFACADKCLLQSRAVCGGFRWMQTATAAGADLLMVAIWNNFINGLWQSVPGWMQHTPALTTLFATVNCSAVIRHSCRRKYRLGAQSEACVGKD